MKKGFSLFELAIVMIIIGMLILIGSKGSAVLRSAKEKSDIAGIKKISTAINAYAADKAGIFPDNFNKNMLERYLTASDFEMRTSPDLDVSQIADGGTQFDVATTQNMVAIIFPPNAATNLALGRSGVVLGCVTDALLDDGTAVSGNVRTYGDAALRANVTNPLECRKTAIRNADQYAFRVFSF